MIVSPTSEDDLDAATAEIISMGRKFYFRTLECPDSLAELSEDEKGRLYGGGYSDIADLVYYQRTGTAMPGLLAEADEPSGVPYDPGDVAEARRRWPRLSARFRKGW